MPTETPSKKVHWASTPEGKKKMSAIMRKRHRDLKKQGKTHKNTKPVAKKSTKPSSKNTNVSTTQDIPAETLAYAHQLMNQT